MTFCNPNVETLRKSQMFSLTWTEDNRANCVDLNRLKRLPNLILIPQCYCSVTYYRDPSPNPSLNDDAHDQHPRPYEPHRQMTRNPLIHLDVVLYGVDRLSEGGPSASSSITIIAKKDGARPQSFKEESDEEVSTTRRWRATWESNQCVRPMKNSLNCCRCGQRNKTYFEVLIDFGNTMGPGQKGVLRHMEKLLADQHLADVAFKFSGINLEQ